ncbi:MAG: SMC-Scp complex subunit ScpB [Synergistaceae bacterium]|nr:SMC-Scp complex subunit ScpB [Synergistaceae bacterium]
MSESSLSLKAKIEALLFMSPDPLSENELKNLLGVSSREIKDALNELIIIFQGQDHGIFLKALAGGWVLETKPELSDLISNFSEIVKTKRVHLSKAAIETAAIIAYNQPVTRSEIDEIRGVHSDSSIARLLEHDLIKIAGRKGKNGGLLYLTTQKFLELFGIDSLENLPAIDEIILESSENKSE